MSHLEGYLVLADVEIANANRTLAYLRTANPAGAVVNEDCSCESIPGTFVSPAADPAPWYDGSDESGEFLGFAMWSVELAPNLVRVVYPIAEGGGRLGALRRKHRLVQAAGSMYALSNRGMRFGERWLEAALAGSADGCNEDELRVLLSCPGEFRNLKRAGIVDGPVIDPIASPAGCLRKGVAYQLAAGEPYLQEDPVTTFPEAALGTTLEQSCFVAANPGKTATRLTIAAGSADVSGIDVYFEPDDGGYKDAYSDAYHDGSGWNHPPGTMPYVEFVVQIPADHTLVVDASNHSTRVYDSNGAAVGGMEATTYSNGFAWMEGFAGAHCCVYVDARGATVNGGTTMKVETIDMA